MARTTYGGIISGLSNWAFVVYYICDGEAYLVLPSGRRAGKREGPPGQHQEDVAQLLAVLS